jgi:hypothetical protein
LKPEVEDLLNSIDLNLVHEAIEASGIQSWDVDSIITRVLQACDLWLLDDLKAGKILVEQEYDHISKGILDLILIPDKNNVCGIVDWKTTGSVKRPNFIEETKSEFQSSLYLAHGGDWIEKNHGVRPQYIEYRALDEEGEFRSFKVNWQESCRADANEQVWSVGSSYNSLWEDYDDSLIEAPCWPRNRPKACFVGSKSGGATCPFYKDCCNMTMPAGLGGKTSKELHALRPRSKSSMKTFLGCPEFFRRTKILGATDDSSDRMNAGVAFHSAIESIYNQVLAI